MNPRTKAKATLQPRFRVMLKGNIGLGPGKAELLDLIQQTGSISEAASRMGMSYMRAWTLVKTMNDCFREPLIATARGGSHRGGATLTETGLQALRLYRQLEKDTEVAARPTWTELRRLMKE